MNKNISYTFPRLLKSCALCALIMAGGGLPLSAVAQVHEINLSVPAAQTKNDYRSYIKGAIERSLKSGQIQGVRLDAPHDMTSFYQARHFEPYWSSKSGLYRRAEKFVNIIEDAWTHGLNPYAYHYTELKQLMAGDHAQGDLAVIEVLLSDAYIRYAHDLSGPRVDISDFGMVERDWRAAISPSQGLDILNEQRSFSHVVKAIEPQGQTYNMMRRELLRLVQDDKDWAQFTPIHFKGILRPGWDHKAVPLIRERLGMQQPSHHKYVYDDHLAAAVIRFQRGNKLNADGVVGANTLTAMNRTKADKIRQLIVNMERLRWAEPHTAQRYVMVNIPSATLWAVDDGQVALEMPVIVGRPARATRLFKTEIHGMRFNPTWTVPPTIKRFDILPKVKEDPSYLSDKGIELIRGYGTAAETLDPLALDWDTMSRQELNSIRMVQVPGDHNALGRYRVLMPNTYNIYLHDTNHPEYFSKSERALSSGCMRMKYPDKMARFIMQGQNGWDDRNMVQTLDSLKLTDVSIDTKIPVQIYYYTVWADDSGHLEYGHDVYGYDEKLLEKLIQLDGFRIPVHNESVKSDEDLGPHLVSFR